MFLHINKISVYFPAKESENNKFKIVKKIISSFPFFLVDKNFFLNSES